MSMTEQVRNLGKAIQPWVTNAFLGLLSWFMLQQYERLNVLEKASQEEQVWRAGAAANRYTSADGYAHAAKDAEESARLWREIGELKQSWVKDISEIRVQLSQMPKRDELPPQWWRDYTKTIEKKIDDHVSGVRP